MHDHLVRIDVAGNEKKKIKESLVTDRITIWKSLKIDNSMKFLTFCDQNNIKYPVSADGLDDAGGAIGGSAATDGITDDFAVVPVVDEGSFLVPNDTSCDVTAEEAVFVDTDDSC